MDCYNQAYLSIVTCWGGARDACLADKKGEPVSRFFYIHRYPGSHGCQYAQHHAGSLETSLRRTQSQAESLMGILQLRETDSGDCKLSHCAFRYLSRQGSKGREIAEKIALASQFAEADPYRAATYNKGI